MGSIRGVTRNPSLPLFLIPKHRKYDIVSDIETQWGDMSARLPRPGTPVRGSTTGRPIMAAMDLLGRRWTLRIVWELRDGPLGARSLQSRCDRMSSSVLYQRLNELTDAHLLAREPSGAYRLTDLGAALAPALESLDAWARRWAASG
jgi:DNA-binding HxlR family transcriptional regulator